MVIFASELVSFSDHLFISPILLLSFFFLNLNEIQNAAFFFHIFCKHKPTSPEQNKTCTWPRQALGFLSPFHLLSPPLSPGCSGNSKFSLSAELCSLVQRLLPNSAAGHLCLPESLKCTQENKGAFHLISLSPLHAAAHVNSTVFPPLHTRVGHCEKCKSSASS